jgi:nuclear GTP-binding protein
LADSILRRASVSYFSKLYELPEYHSPEEFLALKAQKMGIFVKGGAPDLRSAARSIIHDWNTGKIKYCTHPPEIDADVHVSAVIISNDDVTPEIDPNELEAAQNEIMDRIERRQNYEKEMNVEDDSALIEETMEIESAGSVSIKLSRSDNRTMDLLSELKGQAKIVECDENDEEDEDEPSTKRKKRQATEDDYDNKKFRKDPIFKLEGEID